MNPDVRVALCDLVLPLTICLALASIVFLPFVLHRNDRDF